MGLHQLSAPFALFLARAVLTNATQPLAFTDSMSVGSVYQTLVTHGWAISHALKEAADVGYAHFGFPVVGETWGGGVTDIFHGRSTLKHEDVMEAIKDAETRTEVGEGGYGGGKYIHLMAYVVIGCKNFNFEPPGAGMLCQGHKGGTGTSSRVVPGIDGKNFTVGVLTQTNYGQLQTLQIGGVPVGKFLAADLAKEKEKEIVAPSRSDGSEGSQSISPLLDRQLT